VDREKMPIPPPRVSSNSIDGFIPETSLTLNI
jgi:hypothetical protein